MGERRKVTDAHEALNRGLADPKGAIGSQAQHHNKRHDDHKDHIQGLRDIFEQEAKSRNKDKALITTTLNQIHAKLEGENNERLASVSGLSEQIRLISEALNVESQERSGGLQRETTMRDQALTMIKQQIEGVKTSISIEKDERIAEVATLAKKTATSDNQLAQKLEEVRLNLEGEASLRAAGDERLERRIAELRTNVDAHITMNASSMQELDQRVRSTGQSLDTEVRTRTEEASKHVSANNHLREMLTGLETVQTKGHIALQEKVKGICETLLEHEKIRSASADDVSKRMKDVIAMIETERHDREQGVTTVRNYVENLKQLLAGEKEDRINELSTLRRNLHVEDGKVKQALEDAKHSLELEASNEKNERAADMSAYKRNLSALEGHTAQQIKDIRQTLESEMSERVMANERTEIVCNDMRSVIAADRAAQEATTKDLDKAIKQNRQATETETKERTNLFEENSHNLTEIRQMLSNFRGEVMGEKEDRIEDVSAIRMLLQSFDQKVMVQLRECKIGLETEMSERTTNTERLEKRLAELRGAVLVAVRGPGAR